MEEEVPVSAPSNAPAAAPSPAPTPAPAQASASPAQAMSSPPPVDVEQKVMADSGVAATVSVSLHPLVIMNISEHWTRVKAQEGRPVTVYGALIGRQAGRDIELCNSFELDYNVIDGVVVIDRDYYNTKEEQFKQVFSDMDF